MVAKDVLLNVVREHDRMNRLKSCERCLRKNVLLNSCERWLRKNVLDSLFLNVVREHDRMTRFALHTVI